LEPKLVRDRHGWAARSAGFELLPTFQAPHYDVVLPAATLEVATTLVSVFGAAQRNPYLRRR